MAYVLELELPGLPTMNANVHRRHWSIQYRETCKWKVAVRAAVGRRRPEKPLERARVRCVRFSAVEPDFDNLAYSFKPLIDGLVEAGVLRGDGPTALERQYGWSYASRGKGRVRLEVEGLEEGGRGVRI